MARKKAKRNPRDYYQTPYSLTRLLLSKEQLQGTILEPAFGEGAITKVLDEYNYTYVAKDLKYGDDFLQSTTLYTTIITNPPFSICFDFIQKAKELSTYLYLLMPLNYLHGKQRFDYLWQDTRYPLECIYVFTRYPFMSDTIREDGKCGTGMMVTAWYKWYKNYTGQPVIKWLDNNKDIVKKSEE